uniref:Uncharacterized protein n=1 Tax=Romanomermis culicivorax TaxID=13658 RepID=A0A915HVB1_ROMCU
MNSTTDGTAAAVAQLSSAALHNSNSYQSDQIKGYRGNGDLDEILNFIEGARHAAQTQDGAGKTLKTKKSAKKKQKKIVKKNCHSDENPGKIRDGALHFTLLYY